VTAAMSEAEARRADLRLVREQLVFAAQVRRQTWADFTPALGFNFQGWYQTPPTQTEPTKAWQLLATLSFPIYDGGLRYGLLKERRTVEDEARFRVDNQLRLVRASVRTAIVELERAEAALGTARSAAQISADVVRLTTVSYRAGLSTNIEVIDAQLAALNADVLAALAANDKRQAELDLLLATGQLP
jgi:outer membrane protein TolC